MRELRETTEMSYQFTAPLVVDHSAYAALLGEHSTPLDVALAETLRSCDADPREPGR